MLDSRNYTFLGTTQSLCPECLSVVPAKIIARGKRVYFRKRCPTHGLREDFVCSDRRWYDRYDYALPPKLPKKTFVEASKGCPLDCGLCTEHEQHTCVAVLEITDNCNLSCPLCYADSRPGLKHKSVAQAFAAIDALVRAEGKADVLQISGGEPTTHPQLEEIIEYALSQPIDYIMINTNGIRFAKDVAFVERLGQHWKWQSKKRPVWQPKSRPVDPGVTWGRRGVRVCGLGFARRYALGRSSRGTFCDVGVMSQSRASRHYGIVPLCRHSDHGRYCHRVRVDALQCRLACDPRQCVSIG